MLGREHLVLLRKHFESGLEVSGKLFLALAAFPCCNPVGPADFLLSRRLKVRNEALLLGFLFVTCLGSIRITATVILSNIHGVSFNVHVGV